jgi:hypothetical protein
MSVRLHTLLAALLVGLAACERNPNQVDEYLLRPVLAGEQEETKAYLEKLPEGVYKEYAVAVGRFYVDDENDMIKRMIVRNMVWDQYLIELYPKYVKPGTTVIDAGAHIGTHTMVLARLTGARGRVYSFEPQRKLHRELVYNLRCRCVMRWAILSAPSR